MDYNGLHLFLPGFMKTWLMKCTFTSPLQRMRHGLQTLIQKKSQNGRTGRNGRTGEICKKEDEGGEVKKTGVDTPSEFLYRLV